MENDSGDPLPWTLTRGETRWQGHPEQRTLVNAPDMLLRFACAGLGITSVGEHFARPYVERGELVRVLPGWCLPPAPCWAVFPARKLMPLRTRVFLEALSAELAQCPAPPD